MTFANDAGEWLIIIEAIQSARYSYRKTGSLDL